MYMYKYMYTYVYFMYMYTVLLMWLVYGNCFCTYADKMIAGFKRCVPVHCHSTCAIDYDKFEVSKNVNAQ